MRHHSPSAKKMKQKNPRSNAWCRYRGWWWRWCAQGPTRRHFGWKDAESLGNKLLSSSDPHQVPLCRNIFWHAIWHSHFISYIFCNSFWHSIWYIFGDSLWLRPGGQYSDNKFRCFYCCFYCCCCCCYCCCCCWFCCCCCCWCCCCCCGFVAFFSVP